MDSQRDGRAVAQVLRVPQAAFRGPRRQDRGRRLRGPDVRLPADAAAPAKRAARGALADAKRRGALERGDEPHPARARPRGVAAGDLSRDAPNGYPSIEDYTPSTTLTPCAERSCNRQRWFPRISLLGNRVNRGTEVTEYTH